MKILVTGSNGLVGSAIKEESINSPHEFIFASRKDADLTKAEEVDKLFSTVKPNWVIHTGARVGGVAGNMHNQGSYFYENILMNAYIIHYAWKHNVQKLLAFSSVCVFPDEIFRLKEDLIHKGEPYKANFAYAHAKRMIDIQIKAYQSQYNLKNYCSIIPCNIIGKNDLYNLEHGHVLPALIHKLYLAKKTNQPFRIWGNGSSLREFIYSNDLAKICLKIIDLPEIPTSVIVSSPKQITIKELVERLCKAANFDGEVIWETDKPNGQHARPTDLTLLKKLVGKFDYTNFDEVLKISYNWFEENYPKVRT